MRNYLFGTLIIRWVGSDYLFGTAKDLREKYQERYAGYSNSEGLGQFRNPAPIELNMAEISMVVKLNRTL